MRFLVSAILLLGALNEFACESEARWYDSMVVYQIIPDKFVVPGENESILQAVARKADYFKELGVNVLYMTSIFATSQPEIDMGYAIDDHKKIDPRFGTLKDLESLIEKMHGAGIKIMLDLVASFTSNKHTWFEKWLNGNEHYKNFYISAAEKINDWTSVFNKSAWVRVKNPQTGDEKYYLTQFLEQQPMLDLTQENVYSEVERIMDWLLDIGVDGIRLSHAEAYTVDPYFRNNAGMPNDRYFLTHQGPSFEILSRFQKNIDEFNQNQNEERVLVTQVNHKDLEVLKMYYGQRYNSKIVDTVYRKMPQSLLNSSLVKYLDDTKPMAQQYARITNDFYEYLSLIGGSTLWTANAHEWPRTTAQFGVNEAEAIRTVIAMLNGSCAFLYGEEIGMTSEQKQSDDEWFDGRTDVKKVWKSFDWGVQQSLQNSDKPNTFKHFKRLLKIRNILNNLIAAGSVKSMSLENDAIFLFAREHLNSVLIVACNFSSQPVSFTIPQDISSKDTSELFVLESTPNIVESYPVNKKLALKDKITLVTGSSIVMANFVLRE